MPHLPRLPSLPQSAARDCPSYLTRLTFRDCATYALPRTPTPRVVIAQVPFGSFMVQEKVRLARVPVPDRVMWHLPLPVFARALARASVGDVAARTTVADWTMRAAPPGTGPVVVHTRRTQRMRNCMA